MTIVNVWNDADAIPGEPLSAKAKVASSINPVRKTWKVTSRAKVLGGTSGVVFAKAGLFLVGDAEPFVGVEADKIVKVPRLVGTNLFGNVNFKSSRPAEKPIDRVVGSVGVQQTVKIADGFKVTFRAGVDRRDGVWRTFISPIPFGRYF